LEDRYSDLPIAETFPLDASTSGSTNSSTLEVSASRFDYSDTSDDAYNTGTSDLAVTTSRPGYQPEPMVQNAYREPVENIRQNCSSPQLNLMPKGSIRFLHNSAKLTWKSRQRMELALPVLQRCSDLRLEIAGHTDVTGTDGLNSDISRARAERIYQYLLDNGIAARRLTVASYGDGRPAQANDTRFGRAMNRRVELVVQR